MDYFKALDNSTTNQHQQQPPNSTTSSTLLVPPLNDQIITKTISKNDPKTYISEIIEYLWYPSESDEPLELFYVPSEIINKCLDKDQNTITEKSHSSGHQAPSPPSFPGPKEFAKLIKILDSSHDNNPQILENDDGDDSEEARKEIVAKSFEPAQFFKKLQGVYNKNQSYFKDADEESRKNFERRCELLYQWFDDSHNSNNNKDNNSKSGQSVVGGYRVVSSDNPCEVDIYVFVITDDGGDWVGVKTTSIES